MSEYSLNPLDREFEKVLGRLQPQTSQELADRLLFEAGRASNKGGGRPWQVVSGVLAVVLVGVLIVRPESNPRSEEMYVSDVPIEIVSVQQVDSQVDSSKEASYLRLRHTVLESGVDALPTERRSDGDGVRMADRLRWLEEDFAI